MILDAILATIFLLIALAFSARSAHHERRNHHDSPLMATSCAFASVVFYLLSTSVLGETALLGHYLLWANAIPEHGSFLNRATSALLTAVAVLVGGAATIRIGFWLEEVYVCLVRRQVQMRQVAGVAPPNDQR